MKVNLKDFLQILGTGINQTLQNTFGRMGFLLMVFPFEYEEGKANYVSNANRADMIKVLKGMIKQLEKAPVQNIISTRRH